VCQSPAALVAAFVDATALCGARWVIGVRDAGAIDPGGGRSRGGRHIAAVVLGARGRAGLVTTLEFAQPAYPTYLIRSAAGDLARR